MLHKAKRIYRVSIVIVVIAFILSPSAFAATSEQSFSLSVLAPSEEAAPTPTPTPIPGWAPPGLVVYPYLEQEIFVSGEDRYRPYVRVITVSGQAVIPDTWFQTMSREPVFLGKTNLKNAILYISVDSSNEKVYTTFANIQGVWKFTSPAILPYGIHTVFITAMSPVNPYFKTEKIFQFEVIPISLPQEPIAPLTSKPYPSPTIYPIPAPSVFAPPTPQEAPSPISSPIPAPILKKPIEHIFIPPISEKPEQEKKIEGIYGLNVEVMPESKNISGGKDLNIKTKIINPVPDQEKDVLVRLIIRDPEGRIIYDETEKYKVKNTLEFSKNMMLSQASKVGRYTVTQEIIKDGVTYSTSDYFEVQKSHTVSSNNIISTIFILLFFISFFLILYIREYIQSKKQIPVNDEHFRDNGLIR